MSERRHEAEHPEMPGVFCERDPCVAFHRNGSIVWTDGALPLPSVQGDSERMLGVLRRAQAKASRPPETS